MDRWMMDNWSWLLNVMKERPLTRPSFQCTASCKKNTKFPRLFHCGSCKNVVNIANGDLWEARHFLLNH